MVRGIGVPGDVSHKGSPTFLLVRTWHCPAPRLPLSLLCRTSAELGDRDDEPGDGVVHETFPALTLDQRCLHHQAELGIPPGLILTSQTTLCISLAGIWLRNHSDMATSLSREHPLPRNIPDMAVAAGLAHGACSLLYRTRCVVCPCR